MTVPDWHDPEFWRWAIEHCKASPSVLMNWFDSARLSGWQHRRRWAATEYGIDFPFVPRNITRTVPRTPPDGWPVMQEATGVPDDAGMPEPPEQKDERDKLVHRLRGEVSELKSQNRRLLEAANVHEAVLELAREKLPALKVPKIQPVHVGTSKTVEDAILGWADAHAGERVFSEVMEGLNAYDPALFCRRTQYTVDKTLSLLFDNHAGTTFERLYVFDLGDSVTGDALDDNKATNAIGVFESCVFCADVKARALTDLSTHIPVIYVSVPGNHGRRGAKMPWKQPTETADWLIAEMIRLRCAGNDRITFVVPKSWSAVVEIRGHFHRLNHGYSAAKGGHGGVPWYAYMRRDSKMTAIESVKGQQVRYRWYGHIHTQAEIPKMGGTGEQFIVGSLKGGDEYAYNELGEFSGPTQKLVGAHEHHGVSWRQPLNVDRADDVVSRYEDAIENLTII